MNTKKQVWREESIVAEAKEWRRWSKELPFIPVKDGWQIKPIPPFAGATARFLVKLPDGREKSIYFDSDDSLGYMEAPYWEVHPVEGDCGRCLVNEVEKLVELIEAPSNEANAPSA